MIVEYLADIRENMLVAKTRFYRNLDQRLIEFVGWRKSKCADCNYRNLDHAPIKYLAINNANMKIVKMRFLRSYKDYWLDFFAFLEKIKMGFFVYPTEFICQKNRERKAMSQNISLHKQDFYCKFQISVYFIHLVDL